MNSPSDDKAFDEYLGRRSRVSQNYRGLPSGEVPAHLDQQILAQARAAIASGADELARVRARRRRLLQWSVPAAVAASALLVVSIVIRSGVEHEVTPADFPADFQAAKQVPASAPAAQVAKPEAAGTSTEESVVLIAPPRDAVTEFSSYARKPSPRDASQAKRTAAAQPQQVPAMSPPTASAPTPMAPPPPQVAAMQERAVMEAARREQEEQVAVTAQRQETAKQSVSAMAMQRSRSIGESANVADAPLSVARLHADPDDWLEHIRQLRRDGQQAAADREWQQFEATYPDHPVAATDLARTKQDSR
ncbi:hypothetical protein [Povalibacter sp.]|uniref:hypothetical protein n=1 Tax=Povalibacter sp. TaxID=1962978 RepID=UPI002F411717